MGKQTGSGGSVTAGPLANLRERTFQILADAVGESEEVALVDFPNHQNSGDSLIWSGELQYLRGLGKSVGYVADISRYRPEDLRQQVPEGAILIHGGGNFGDRWPQMQEFHEKVVSDFPDRRIVQLPQTIDFSCPSSLSRAQRVYSAHENLTLLIRDNDGAATTSDLFVSNDVQFCPDMAFGAQQLMERVCEPSVDILFLRRGDCESILDGQDVAVPSQISYRVADWGLRGRQSALWKALHVPGAIAKRSGLARKSMYPITSRMFHRMAELNISNAAATLSAGRVVITDRLHAAVMCALMDIPVVALNNANGKVAAIYRDYLGAFPAVSIADSVEQGMQECLRLLDI